MEKEVIYNFLDYILDKNYSDHTEVNYEIDLDKFSKYLNDNNLNYLKLKHKDISNFIIDLSKSKYKPSSINRIISTIRTFYKYLENNNKIKENPTRFVKNLKQEKEIPNYFKYEEFEEMINSIPDNTLGIRNKLILEMLFASGLRISELVNIKIKDIDISEREIKVLGKGNKERYVFFGSYASDALEVYLDNSRNKLIKNKQSEYLLLNNNGTNLTERGVRYILDNIIKNTSIKLNVTPHTFRHSFATIMLKEGSNIKNVSEYLGHSSLKTTSKYTHINDNFKRKVYLSSHPRA